MTNDWQWSREAEGALLGSLILLADKPVAEIHEIKDEWFYLPEHQIIFRAIYTAATRYTSWDLVILRNTLKEMNALEAVGGVEYLVKLGEATPCTANLGYYFDIVKSCYHKRRLASIADNTLNDLHQPGSVIEKVGHMHTALQSLEQEIAGAGVIEVCKAIDTVDFSQETFVSTGFDCIDRRIYGLGKGDMIVIAGRPSTGKSCLLLNIATNMASAGKHILMFSLEMRAKQLMQRMLCTLARVNLKDALNNRLTKAQRADLEYAKTWVREHRLCIDDTPLLTPDRLRAQITRFTRSETVDAVFLDYLQLMQNPRYQKTYEKVSDISRNIKILANEFNLPIVVAAQLNRQVDDREDRRPRMSDLRDSGAIEQDADIVMLLHRKDTDPENTTGHTDLITDKNRRGEIGADPLVFLGPHTVFVEP